MVPELDFDNVESTSSEPTDTLTQVDAYADERSVNVFIEPDVASSQGKRTNLMYVRVN
jgi:hypothetical protein